MLKKKKEKEYYFAEKEEQAVKDYQKAETQSERNSIYEKSLHKPLEKLISAIVRKYPKFIGNCGIEELQERILIHIYDNLLNFNPDRIGKNGQLAKAYSYFGTLANNYYKTHSSKTNAVENRNDDITQYNPDLLEEYIVEHYDPEVDEKVDVLEKALQDTIEVIQIEVDINKKLKVNEIKVGNSIIFLLSNYKEYFIDDINGKVEYTKKGKIKKTKYTNIYTKNKIFYILREISGLNSKDFRLSLIPYKDLYKKTKNKILLLEL